MNDQSSEGGTRQPLTCEPSKSSPHRDRETQVDPSRCLLHGTAVVVNARHRRNQAGRRHTQQKSKQRERKEAWHLSPSIGEPQRGEELRQEYRNVDTAYSEKVIRRRNVVSVGSAATEFRSYAHRATHHSR